MSHANTVRVVATDEASQGPFVVINAADYDESVHTLFDEADAEPTGDTPAKKPGRPRKAAETPVEGN